MARKGNQQKNGIDRNSSSLKKKVSDSGSPSPDTERQAKEGEVRVGAGEELSNGNHPRSPSAVTASKAECIRNEKKSKQKTHKFLKEENRAAMATDSPPQNMPNGSNMEDGIEKTSTREAFGSREEIGTLPGGSHGNEYAKSSYSCSQSGLHTENGMKLSSSDLLVGRNFRGFAFSTLKATGEWMDTVVSGTLRSSALSIWKASADWLERLKPLFIALAANIHKARDYARINFEQAYPIVLQWIRRVGKIMLLILMVWLDCTLSGIGSFLRMGTTSFFSVIWCSILSVIAMSGIFKFLVVLAMAALIGLFVGLTLAILVIAISGTVLLWLYGSFWTTTLVIFIAGLAFLLSHERLALLVTTVYSLYCVWAYNQWTGLLLGLNLSFISSDVLVYFLKNNLNEHRRSGGPQHQAAGTRSRPGLFHNDTMHYSSSEMGSGQSEDRSPGVPSTSGADSETTSEDEVLRLLNSTDHYSALGLSRYETIDVSLLKREYKKKAMLVHPDKNMGNEKAAEAFKKLQNAYEVLLDALKRQAYDDELRREELLNYFRRFQSASQKHRNHGLFASGFARSEADGEDLLGESRRIPCKKCCSFHIWVHTKKSKSRARWCQDCQDFHQARDGDGWVEQSSQPVFFGLFQKVDVPSAYVCAESRIYDATNWYICQGMRCPANTHKPSFHVNTSVNPKPSGRGTSSGHRGGEMPGFNMEESMTEEEIVEWLQAMQAGMFGTSSSNGTTSAKNESCSKNSGGRSSSSSSSSKRKKKGKKQR